MTIDGYTTPGTERETSLEASVLLSSLDAAGIDRAVIAPEDRELAFRNAEGNERILRLARESGGRLIPACGVSPWRGAEALAVLDRAADAGARMVVLAPMLQGFIPTDGIADPLIEHAGRRKLPVYVHTGPHSAGAPTQVVLLAGRHPGTHFILGHCGSTDYSWDMPSILRHHARDNVWYDTSLVRPWAVDEYVRIAGSERFLFASGAPRNDVAFEMCQLERFLPRERHPDIYGGNLARLIGDES